MEMVNYLAQMELNEPSWLHKPGHLFKLPTPTGAKRGLEPPRRLQAHQRSTPLAQGARNQVLSAIYNSFVEERWQRLNAQITI